ncbi:MAG: hypothetical protein ACOYM2_19930 [Rectinemataceae bacterium]
MASKMSWINHTAVKSRCPIPHREAGRRLGYTMLSKPDTSNRFKEILLTDYPFLADLDMITAQQFPMAQKRPSRVRLWTPAMATSSNEMALVMATPWLP